MAKKTFSMDGIEFQSKTEYRDYMIDKYLSFKNKSFNDGGPFVKKPNDVNGQPFDINNCKSCSLVVMDLTEQVQIDHLKSCKVFIGACSSSLFIRDCRDCVFYVCSRQLRFRDCHNCIVYSFTQSEIHIELSNRMRFGPFNGGYKDQKQHFEAAGLNVEINYWDDVFDHNDPDKHGNNWSLLNDLSDPWFPDGSTVCFVNSKVSSKQSQTKHESQVGEAFGFNQLITDSTIKSSNANSNTLLGPISGSTKRIRNLDSDVDKIGEEISLLVILADTKNKNLHQLLTKDCEGDSVPASSFIQNLLQLAVSLIADFSDVSSRQELEAATSEKSLKTILELCRDDSLGKKGNPFIDVKYFLHLCKKKYALLTDGADNESENHNAELSFSLPSSFGNAKNRARYEGEDLSTINSAEGWQYTSMEEKSVTAFDKSFPSALGSRSVLPASPDKFSKYGDSKSPHKSPIKIPTESVHVPASPYDEEIKFSDDEGDNVADYSTNNLVDGVASLSTGLRNQPSLVSANFSKTQVDVANVPKFSPSKMVNNLRSRSAPKNKTIEASSRNNGPVNILTEDNKLDKHLQFMQDLTEEQLASTVRQTDLYHKIQVHLGFIDDYTMIPPRGEIIVSKPRPWLSTRDITLALQAGRLKVSPFQIQLIVLLVCKFAQEVNSIESVTAFNQSADSKKPLSSKSVVKDGPLLNSMWFKKYLTYLRLTKRQNSMSKSLVVDGKSITKRGVNRQRSSSRPRSASVTNNMTLNSSESNSLQRPRSQSDVKIDKSQIKSDRVIPIQWEEWLGMKVMNSKVKREGKPREFRKALAGLQSNLTSEDIISILKKFQIIPDDILDEEIRFRVRKWVLDIDGRRDFRHDINHQIQAWQIHEKLSFQKQSIDKRKIVLDTIKQKLIAKRTDELKNSESTGQIITKELFFKYREECQEKSFQGTSKWGDWLKLQRAKNEDVIKKAVENMKKCRELSKQDQLENDAVIPIQDLAAVIDSVVANGVPVSNALEIKKSFVNLRKEQAKLSASGDRHGISDYSVLVSKGDFSRHLESVLSPMYSKLPEDVKSLADKARATHDDLLKSSTKFFHDRKEAASRAVELESEIVSRKSDTFNKWLKQKNNEKIKSAQTIEDAKKKTELQKQEKAKKGIQAYEKWLKRRKRNKYFSKIDNALHVVPTLVVAQHTTPWIQEEAGKGARQSV